MKMESRQENLLYIKHMSRSASRLGAVLCALAFSVLAFSQAKNPPTQNPPAQTPPVQTVGQIPGPAGTAIDAKGKQDVLDRLQEIVTKEAFVPGVDFSKWPDFLTKHKDDIDKADTDVAFARVLNNTLRDFGVSHIRFRTPKAAQMRQSGTTSGLGMQVKKTDAGLEVTNVLPQGPAGQVGVEVGDVIKEVEHKPASDPSTIQVDLGKTLEVKVLKKTGETKDLTLENKTFSNRRPETLTWIGDDAAVLKVWTFANGYDRKNIESLMEQATAKAKFLVIDLRSNGGGAVSNLNHFLSLLMPDSTAVGTFVSRRIADDYAKAHTDGVGDPIQIAAWAERKWKTNKRAIEPFSGRIAVLINRGSASASEICSAALKDCRDAVLVGSKSAGAVLASVYGRLPGGFELQYPVQDYVTIKGERLEGHPREPDLVIDRAPNGQDDAAQKAIDLMKKRESEHVNSTAKPTGHSSKAA